MISVQKFAWTAVFGSIAVGTGVGILTLATGGANAIGPAVGCAIFTAIAAGMILAFARIATNDKWRLVGLFAIIWVLLELALALLLCTLAASRAFRHGDVIAELCGALFLTGPPVIIAMRFWIIRAHRLAAGIAVVSCALSLLGWMFAVMLEGDFRVAEHFRETAVLIEMLGCCLAIGFAGIGVGPSVWRLLRLISLISTGVALTFGLSGTWQNTFETTWIFWGAGAVTLWLAHFNVMRLCPLSANESFLRWIAVIGVAGVGVLVNVCILSANQKSQTRPPEALAAVAAGVAILAGAATIVVFILSIRSLMRKPLPEHPATYLTLRITCPHCHVSQTLASPESACGDCGMHFRLQVIEPRCPGCDYLLLMYRGDRCPECGIPVRRPPGPVITEVAGEASESTGANVAFSPAAPA